MGRAHGPPLAPQCLRGLRKPLGSGNAGATPHTRLRESQRGRAQCENTNGQHAVGPTNTRPSSSSRAQQGRMPSPTGAGCYQIWGFPQRARSAHCSLFSLGFNKVNLKKNQETKKIARSPSALAEPGRPRLLLPRGPKQRAGAGGAAESGGVGGWEGAGGQLEAGAGHPGMVPPSTHCNLLGVAFLSDTGAQKEALWSPWATQPHRRTGNSPGHCIHTHLDSRGQRTVCLAGLSKPCP